MFQTNWIISFSKFIGVFNEVISFPNKLSHETETEAGSRTDLS